MTLRVLDLFSGIGGFSLGLERTGGFKTVAFCEIEPFCRKVLAKHWPGVPCYHDVRELTADRLRADGISVDVICGGFPCQDISTAGKGAGIEGERSGLWSEYARIIGEVRPTHVIVENVAALLGRGLDCVLGDLAALGFDAEWHCIPASAVGAPHRRDRVWIIAHSVSCQLRHEPRRWNGQGWAGQAKSSNNSKQRIVADSVSLRESQSQGRECDERGWLSDRGEDVPDTDGSRLSLAWSEPNGANRLIGGGMLAANSWWATEPDVGRVAHGIPSRVDRLRGLGNAVVPQIPELIGNAILASLKQAEAAV